MPDETSRDNGIDINEADVTPEDPGLKWLIPAVFVVFVIVAIIVAVIISQDGSGSEAEAEQVEKDLTRLEQAYDECAERDPENRVGVSVGDDGTSLSISGTASLEALVCYLYRLDTPDAVKSRLGSTRALDGAQEARWGGFYAWWTYHPDAGLNMVVEDEEAR